MKLFLLAPLLLLTGCGPGLVFNWSQDMSRDQMLARADLVFIGVIQKHAFDPWPYLRLQIPADKSPLWRIIKREIRIETLLRGAESRKVIDVYEVFWTGGTSGDWNATQNGERDLFMVRVENGHYRLMRDWWRSIFPVTTGTHSRLPLDESHPLWERIALMNYWLEPTARMVYPYFRNLDPGNALGRWRTIKLLRGLVRHPSQGVRMPACRELLNSGWGLDECWEALSESDRSHLHDSGFLCCSTGGIATARSHMQQHDASWWWSHYTDREHHRMLTTVSDPKLRADFCRLYTHEYPGDADTGCAANQPPPATIVTERGDMPLPGPWPR